MMFYNNHPISESVSGSVREFYSGGCNNETVLMYFDDEVICVRNGSLEFRDKVEQSFSMRSIISWSGTAVAYKTNNTTLILYDCLTKKKTTITDNTEVGSMCISPDGKTLLYSTADRNRDRSYLDDLKVYRYSDDKTEIIGNGYPVAVSDKGERIFLLEEKELSKWEFCYYDNKLNKIVVCERFTESMTFNSDVSEVLFVDVDGNCCYFSGVTQEKELLKRGVASNFYPLDGTPSSTYFSYAVQKKNISDEVYFDSSNNIYYFDENKEFSKIGEASGKVKYNRESKLICYIDEDNSLRAIRTNDIDNPLLIEKNIKAYGISSNGKKIYYVTMNNFLFSVSLEGEGTLIDKNVSVERYIDTATWEYVGHIAYIVGDNLIAYYNEKEKMLCAYNGKEIALEGYTADEMHWYRYTNMYEKLLYTRSRNFDLFLNLQALPLYKTLSDGRIELALLESNGKTTIVGVYGKELADEDSAYKTSADISETTPIVTTTTTAITTTAASSSKADENIFEIPDYIDDGNTYVYSDNEDGTITITGGSIVSTNVIIPSYIDGKKVSEIGERAFYECDAIETLIISEGIQSIGWYAFNTCRNLRDLSLPASLEYIDSWAFERCYDLTSVHIPAGVDSIMPGAFAQNTSLTSITVDINNQWYVSEEGILFNKDKEILCAYPAGKEGSYTIPNSVIYIEDAAFYGSIYLTEIYTPTELWYIGSEAFAGCSALKTFYMGDYVTEVGYWAFRGCTKIREITVPISVAEIGDEAFGFLDSNGNKIEDFVLKGYRDSMAYYYANDYGINFVDLNDNGFNLSVTLNSEQMDTYLRIKREAPIYANYVESILTFPNCYSATLLGYYTITSVRISENKIAEIYSNDDKTGYFIFVDDKFYLVDHNEKTVLYCEVDDDVLEQYKSAILDVINNMIGFEIETGVEEYRGEECLYERFTGISNPLTIYADKNTQEIKYVYSYINELEINGLNLYIDESVFDIPNNYEFEEVSFSYLSMELIDYLI